MVNLSVADIVVEALAAAVLVEAAAVSAAAERVGDGDGSLVEREC